MDRTALPKMTLCLALLDLGLVFAFPSAGQAAGADKLDRTVLPIDDRSIERFDAAMAGRPDLMGGRTSLTLYEGMTGIMENAFINVKNRSVTVTADLEIPQGGAAGVILCQGGRFGGRRLYVKDGKPSYVYNWVGLQRYTVSSPQALAPGRAVVKFDFAYDGGRGAGGQGTLYVNGQKVAEGRIEHTHANVFSLDDAADVGVDEGTPVTDEYKERHNKFTGKIHKVTVEIRQGAQAAIAPARLGAPWTRPYRNPKHESRDDIERQEHRRGA